MQCKSGVGRKKPGAPNTFIIDDGVVCTLFGIQSNLCVFLDAIGEVLLNKLKDGVLNVLTPRFIGYIYDLALGKGFKFIISVIAEIKKIQGMIATAEDLINALNPEVFDTNAFCQIPPNGTIIDIDYWMIVRALNPLSDGRELYDALVRTILIIKWNEYCECDSPLPPPPPYEPRKFFPPPPPGEGEFDPCGYNNATNRFQIDRLLEDINDINSRQIEYINQAISEFANSPLANRYNVEPCSFADRYMGTPVIPGAGIIDTPGYLFPNPPYPEGYGRFFNSSKDFLGDCLCRFTFPLYYYVVPAYIPFYGVSQPGCIVDYFELGGRNFPFVFYQWDVQVYTFNCNFYKKNKDRLRCKDAQSICKCKKEEIDVVVSIDKDCDTKEQKTLKLTQYVGTTCVEKTLEVIVDKDCDTKETKIIKYRDLPDFV